MGTGSRLVNARLSEVPPAVPAAPPQALLYRACKRACAAMSAFRFLRTEEAETLLMALLVRPASENKRNRTGGAA